MKILDSIISLFGVFSMHIAFLNVAISGNESILIFSIIALGLPIVALSYLFVRNR